MEKPFEAVERLAWQCGRNTVNVNPPKTMNIRLADAYEGLKRDFKMLVRSSLVIVFEYNGGVEVSVFNGGRMLIKNMKDEKSALNVYNKIVEKLGIKIQRINTYACMRLTPLIGDHRILFAKTTL